MKKGLFKQLLDRYSDGTATDQETTLVESYLDELEKGPVKQRTSQEDEMIQARVFKRIHTGGQERRGLLVSMSKGWKVAAAVAAVLIIGVSVWIGTIDKGDVSRSDAKLAQKDIINAPGVNRAAITLADGSKIFLDSLSNGQLALQDNVKLMKLSDGQIAYQPASSEIVKELRYNTLTNPRGSKVIDMVLSDGSHVWLNAGSSVKYPVTFVGNERKVEITGEAYFEIAHDKSKPFYVSKGGVSVQVLGTKFNVNAYDDEDAVRVTLLEGSVEVKMKNEKLRIKPGQQAVGVLAGMISGASEQSKVGAGRLDRPTLTINPSPNLDQIMAWKNGLFSLSGTDLFVLMRQISRWYDVDIVIETSLPNKKFGGLISREVNLSDVLEALKEYGINAEVKGRKVIVK